MTVPSEDAVERVARAICCPSGVCANQDVKNAVCQSHTFKVEARAALSAFLQDWLLGPECDT